MGSTWVNIFGPQLALVFSFETRIACMQFAPKDFAWRGSFQGIRGFGGDHLRSSSGGEAYRRPGPGRWLVAPSLGGLGGAVGGEGGWGGRRGAGVGGEEPVLGFVQKEH